MPVTYQRADTQITGTTPVLAYTCPANTAAIITDATMTNAQASASVVSVYLVPSGESTVDSNYIQIDKPVNANSDEYLDKLYGKHLKPGDALWVKLDASGSVDTTISIREVV